MKIGRFEGDFRFLANFSPSWVDLDGESYPTVEHAYQAAKTLDLGDRTRVRFAPSPGKAKRLGQRLDLRPDWETIKVEVMANLLRQKFAHPALAAALIATGDTELVEGNSWGDTFWGVDQQKGGLNNLGRLLMQIRQEANPDPRP